MKTLAKVVGQQSTHLDAHPEYSVSNRPTAVREEMDETASNVTGVRPRSSYRNSNKQMSHSAMSSGRYGADIRHMDTSRYVRTNMREYLDKDKHVTCISCQDCIREKLEKRQLLQYKY